MAKIVVEDLDVTDVALKLLNTYVRPFLRPARARKRRRRPRERLTAIHEVLMAKCAYSRILQELGSLPPQGLRIDFALEVLIL